MLHAFWRGAFFMPDPKSPQSWVARTFRAMPTAASLLFLTLYFVRSSRAGLYAWFTQDDAGNLLNMHGYWQHSLREVAGGAVRVVTGVYRPLGGIYYFVLYRAYGFHPIPFRAVCLGVMLANVLLAFALIRRMSRSTVAALFGATLIVHHPAVLELLYSSGTVYEILCFCFYLLTLLCYVVWRDAAERSGRSNLSWPQVAGILALTGAALDSKEMAMTIPAALMLVELFFYPPKFQSWRDLVQVVRARTRAVLATAALVLATLAVKLGTSNPLSNDSRYATHSLTATLDAFRAYHNFLLYGDLFSAHLTLVELLALWTAMAVVAVLLRSRAMKFGLCFLIVSMLPVCLIAPRGGYMIYIPLFGWALWTGALFSRLVEGAARVLPRRLRPIVTVVIVAMVLMGVVRLHASKLRLYAYLETQSQTRMRRFVEHVQQAYPQVPRGARILLVDDHLPEGYGVAYLLRMAYGDPSLIVDRVKFPADSLGAGLPAYDAVIR
jgi:hypothetical protein